jgi:hypothetical protein
MKASCAYFLLYFLRCDSRKKMRTNFTTFFGWHFNFLWVLLICIFIFYVCSVYKLRAFAMLAFCLQVKKGTRKNDFKARKMEKNVANLQRGAKKDKFIKIHCRSCAEDFSLCFVSYACPENMLLYTFWIKNCSNVPSISAFVIYSLSSKVHSGDWMCWVLREIEMSWSFHLNFWDDWNFEERENN